jgi:hypothetical protein
MFHQELTLESYESDNIGMMLIWWFAMLVDEEEKVIACDQDLGEST